MLKSQFAILISNLFIIGSFLSNSFIASMLMLILGLLWLFSAMFAIHLERLERIKLAIAEYNLKRSLEIAEENLKTITKGLKNGIRTNKRR